jgi:hypothetical protein
VFAEMEQNPLYNVGEVLTGLRFNSMVRETTERRQCWRKSRLRRAGFLVPLANWYAGRFGLFMRVLNRSAWFRHESSMYHLLLRQDVHPKGDALLLPHIPGRTLRRLLEEDPRLTHETKAAVSLAAQELARLHHLKVEHPWTGARHLFSHADATADNVLIDTTSGVARWIDFETTHPPGLEPSVKHADDLFTMIISAASIVHFSCLPELCELVLHAYGCPRVATAMVRQMRFWESRSFACPLAFPSLTEQHREALRDALARTPEHYFRSQETACAAETARA